MANEVVVYEAEQAVAKMVSNGDYMVTLPLGNSKKRLVRDVDFGVIPGTKSPSLYKAGAEAICLAYGLVPHISMESKTEEWKKNDKGEDIFFGLYTMKCELHKIGNNGVDYVIASGYGSANTFEKRNGWNKGKPDTINSSIKMAAKRAMVGTVLSISGLSSMFSQDIEDEDFIGKTQAKIAEDKGEYLDNRMVLTILNRAKDTGLSNKKAKEVLRDNGFMDGNNIVIKREDYEKALSLFEAKD